MINLKKFVLNEEGLFSITKPYESIQIINAMHNFIQGDIKELIITDATACMGGDLIRFSKNFKFVNGVEILKANYDCLVQNCANFDCKNVKLYNENYIEIYENIIQDVIYLDPPWGGTSYKSKDAIFLKMDNMELWEIINLIKNKKNTNYLFIKAPLNIALQNISYDFQATIYNKSKCESFKLICIRIK
jgi:site-specific DNA-adenine methylase